MKLVKGQQFKTKWGIWVFIAITNGDDFKCDGCGRYRRHLYEFLGYTNPGDCLTNPEGFNYNVFYGTECVKDFLRPLY